ncbi:MAG: response regulator [Planctomycetes bacterium]|nr:response regulator [Planctomycetota bacterium]
MAQIVIAEDQTHIRHLLAMWMSRHGHHVLEAATGAIALDALRANRIDLLITDVNMPQVDGVELAGRAFDACPGLRGVFIVTARCDQQDLLDQLSDPRIRVFPKPFSPSQLLHEVEDALATTTVVNDEQPDA